MEAVLMTRQLGSLSEKTAMSYSQSVAIADLWDLEGEGIIINICLVDNLLQTQQRPLESSHQIMNEVGTNYMMKNNNLMEEGLKYYCNDIDDTEWKTVLKNAALGVTSIAVLVAAYLSLNFRPYSEIGVVYAGESQSQININELKAAGWDTYQTKDAAWKLKNKGIKYNSTTRHNDLKRAWNNNISDIKSLFPDIKSVIDRYLDGSSLNDEAIRVSVRKDGYVLFTISSNSRRVGFRKKQNHYQYKFGKHFTPEAAETIRQLSPNYK